MNKHRISSFVPSSNSDDCMFLFTSSFGAVSNSRRWIPSGEAL